MTYEEYEKKITELGLSSYAVSELSGVSKAVLSQWKNGRTQPSRTTMNKLQLFFNNYDPKKPNDYINQIQTIKFDIEEDSANQMENQMLRFSIYYLLLKYGKNVSLSEQQYKDLQRGLRAFISAWLQANDIT